MPCLACSAASLTLMAALCLIVSTTATFPQTPTLSATPSAAERPPRATPPTRDPNTPGFVVAKDLVDGTNAPVNVDGNFILGPTHDPAPEMSVQPGVPRGKVFEFNMSSTDSKIFPGIAREPGTFGTPDPADPAKTHRRHQPPRSLHTPRCHLRS